MSELLWNLIFNLIAKWSEKDGRVVILSFDKFSDGAVRKKSI